jgi:hypothetical protein
MFDRFWHSFSISPYRRLPKILHLRFFDFVLFQHFRLIVFDQLFDISGWIGAAVVSRRLVWLVWLRHV